MMFIKYQHVRNVVVVTSIAIVGAVVVFIGSRGGGNPASTTSMPIRAVADAEELSPAPIMAESSDVDLPGPVPSAPPSQPLRTNVAETKSRATDQQRYVAALEIATSKADPSGKGKDVLGSRSPWKLNLYDDDRDGHWDRAKLDYDRDEVDDEKWNFKQGRWEKDGGATIWTGQAWVADR